jgi:hypothetical protein
MRYVIGFLVSIGLLILVFVLIFRGGGSNQAPNVPRSLVDYANTTTIVRYTDDYPVSADQTHRQVVTTVGRDHTSFVVQSGYEGTPLKSQSYENNPTAYSNFLRALQLAGYTTSTKDNKPLDERGYCPTGHRYTFEVLDGSRVIQHLWSTSCGNIGNFKGEADTIRSLYRRQVPDYNKLTAGLSVF